MNKKFSIYGMSCSACSNGIEKAVSKLNGVSNVQVSLLSKSMNVIFDQNIVSTEVIVATVEKLGYTILEYGESQTDNLVKKMKERFVLSLIILIPLMYLSMAKMLSLPVFESKINYILQAILALAIIIINRKFYINGFKAVINLSPNMDTRVGLGSASAYVYSIIETILLFSTGHSAHVFYEASAMVLVLVTLGKWLEEISKRRTSREIEKLQSYIPKTVVVLRNDKEYTILTSQLNEGDVVVFKAGDYIVVDGMVVKGNATIDKSAITGESLPEEVVENSNVTSGCIVKNGYIQVLANKVGMQTLFSKIITAVQTAGSSKAPIQRFVDKVARWFVPIVTAISVFTFVLWLIILKDVYKSFNFAISVLVVSCPCALGLATPVAVMTAMGKSVSLGILFKDAQALQKAKKINCVLLDKTSTLTQGNLTVTDYKNFSETADEEIFSICYALEEKSNHPLSQAILEFTKGTHHLVEDYDYVIGKGIKGYINGQKYTLGSFNIPQDLLEEYSGKSVIVLTKQNVLICAFAVSDTVKANSKKAITQLNSMGIKTVMLTGDNYTIAQKIANQVGIKEFKAQVLPEDKLNEVINYQKQGYFTAMVGDGINDSPAIKGADLGIAMGNGTDIAIDSCDVVLVGGNVENLSHAVAISKKADKIIKGNLFWALFYNVLAIPISAGALSFIGITLTPIICSVAMCLSSIFVVTNALRINNYNKNKVNQISNKKTTIIVDGMMCKHCEQKVKQALEDCQTGIVVLSQNHNIGIVKVKGNLDYELAKTSIEQAGFKIIKIK